MKSKASPVYRIVSMAWRNIWRNKMRSVIIISSVALGIFAGVAILGLYKGILKSRVRTVIDKEVGHLQLHHPEFKKDYKAEFIIPLSGSLMDQVRSWPEIRSLARRSVTTAMLATATGASGVQVNGIYPPEEESVSAISSKIAEGSLFDPAKKNQILISRKLSDKLKIKLGNKIVLTFSDKDNNIQSGAFRVCGLFQTINTPLDERTVYLRQDDLNELLNIPGESHEIVLILQSDDLLDSVQQRLNTNYSSLLAETWKEISPETQLMVVSVNEYMYIFIIIIMLALAFGIVNTMLMAILERTREVGMMTALGFTKPRLFGLILSETILLTLAGVPAGIALAWTLIWYFNKYGIDLGNVAKESMSSFGFESTIYPEFPYDQLPMVLSIVAATAILASVLPSLKAMNMQPSEALRR